MATLTGRIEDQRIRIPVGIAAGGQVLQMYDPMSVVGIDYRIFNALVDTGARRTCISANVVQNLGLTHKGRAEVWNVKRPELHWTYLFRVAIFPDCPSSTPSAPFGIGDEIEGIDVGNNRFFDVLIGMDILMQCAFRLERSGAFRFDF